LSCFIEKLDENEVLEAVMVARMIWLRRNSYVFQHEFFSPFRVDELAKEALKDFATAQQFSSRSFSPSLVSSQVWKKPTVGVWKINCDAAIQKEK
jgi:ribonuclease HI